MESYETRKFCRKIQNSERLKGNLGIPFIVSVAVLESATCSFRENENPLKSLFAPAEAGTAGESRGVLRVNSGSNQ